MASASGPVMPPWKKSSWRCALVTTCSRWRPGSTRATSCPPPGWCPPSPGFPSSPTRPSSAPMPLPMSRASTRTACSSTGKPTRSCGPRTSAGRPTSWGWASCPAGVPRARGTSVIMRAEDSGWRPNQLVLGKLSGRAAFRARLEELGISLADQETLDRAFERFKELADKKREIYDEDLHALVSDVMPARSEARYRLQALEVQARTGTRPRVRLSLTVAGAVREAESEGAGPVDAAFKAIEQLANSEAELLLYSVNAITTGTDSQGEVTVRLSRNGVIVNGSGADTDIIVASVKAYLDALNLLESGIMRAHPQKAGV